MLISIIIPFYNVERYIAECLKSLELLPEDRCEILLIDDCGQDSSLSAAEAFCQNRRNARVIRRAANGGLSAARNTGLDAAQGNYVYFLDSDDIPCAFSILNLAEQAVQNQLQMAGGCFTYFDDQTDAETPGPAIQPSEIQSGTELFCRLSRSACYEPMVWQWVFDRQFLLVNGLQMAEGSLFEDELFTTPALLRAERVQIENRMLLRYRQRPGSIMHAFDRSEVWCTSYMRVCRTLANLSESYPAARSELQERLSRIALSFAKNIPAYGVKGEAKAEALAYLHEHKKEIVRYAWMGGTISLRAQAFLLNLSPELFISLYSAAMHH